MKLLIGLTLLLFTTVTALHAQSSLDSLLQKADSLYKQKQFDKAAPLLERSAEMADDKLSKGTYYYYSANAYSRAGDTADSWRCLTIAVQRYGFNDIPTLKTDDSFDYTNKSDRWKKLIAGITPAYTADPLKALPVDSDVKHFWMADDAAQANPSAAAGIYKTEYIDKGTLALQDYYVNKIGSMESFVRRHRAYAKFYHSIRVHSLQAAQYRQQYTNSFVKLKKLYPDAIFSNIYFVMGKFNSAGTSGSNGVIIGIDQRCYAPGVDTSELGEWEKKNLTSLAGLPYTVAHEMIHFNQTAMGSDTTLLKAAIVEGMADFIGELISGKTTNERLKIYARGREQQIWADFKKEMYLNRGGNWIANSEQETADKPADLGYWVGYEICRSYYEKAADKKKAIYDMLHIQDYNKFLADSGASEKFGRGG